jgi:hypothetical protein
MHHHVIFLLSHLLLLIFLFFFFFFFFFSLIPPIETLPSSFHSLFHSVSRFLLIIYICCSLFLLLMYIGRSSSQRCKGPKLDISGFWKGAKNIRKRGGDLFLFFVSYTSYTLSFFFSFMSYECFYLLFWLIVCIPGAVSYSFSCRYVLCQIVL